MASTAAELEPTIDSGEHGQSGGGHHDPFVAHHFDSAKHQFDAGKLGIWIFLVTEVLFFSGLFCAYAIYRSLHPEIFVYAHYYLDSFWGALNTGVLILSSLTAAWAVRNAQLGQRKALIVNICATIVCAFGFMGVKYVEYSHKFHENILPGTHFNPTHEVWELDSYKQHESLAGSHGPEQTTAGELAEHGGAATVPPPNALARPRNASIFFGIYFCMTGLHGIHVLGGIVVWLWLLKRAIKGEFGPRHFGAVDYAALYWHLVDLIWIYLFPLLYLIH